MLKGLYNLRARTQYIEVEGRAVPLDQLQGEVYRGLFYPASDPTNGRLIKTRRETVAELHRSIKGSLQPTAASGFDASDWK